MINRIRRIPAAIAGILLCSLTIIPGCGYESALKGAEFPPLSGDVIVVGEGLAGLTAAFKAARQGAAVFVLGGTNGEDGWLWEQGAAMFKANQDSNNEVDPAGEKEDDTLMEGFREHLSGYGGGSGSDRHLDVLVERTVPDMSWFSELTGLKFTQEETYLYRPENLSRSQVYSRLREAALEAGVRFLDDCAIKEFIYKDEGGIRGLIFAGGDGETRELYAPAVILADGGYLGNEDLMAELAPAAQPASWRAKQSGVGFQLGLSAGLDLLETNLFAYAPAMQLYGEWIKADWPPRALLTVEERVIPLDGKTVEDLTLALKDSPGMMGFLLVAGSHFIEDDIPWPEYEGIDSFMEVHDIDSALLRRWFAHPRGVFYGLPVKAVAEYCLGGIAVNDKSEALRDNEAFSGLYVIGEAAGGLHGENLAPGAAMSEAVIWGRLVGKEAASVSQ